MTRLAHFAAPDYAVGGFALLTVACWLIGAFLADRDLNVDELGLFNPVYMYLHYGKMTYPVHYWFDSMVVHPPVHYLQVALLMKSGLGLYYAEAVPVVVLFVLTVWLVCRAHFPWNVKIGLMFGLFAAPMLIGGEAMSPFGLRPDTHVAVAWFAGLVALESARLAGWSNRRLLLGSFLLTYASGVHYFAAMAFTGALVYMVWLWRDRGLRGSLPGLAAIVCGGLLFGIPYLVWFVWPSWDGIRAMTSTVQAGWSLHQAVLHHFAAYDFFARGLNDNLAKMPVVALPLLPPLSLHVPVIVISTLAFLWVPSTRGLALASLPVPLLVLLYSQLKSTGYYVPELMLYLSAVGMILVAALSRVLAWVLRGRGRGLPALGAATVLGIGMVLSSPGLLEAGVTLSGRVHQMEIARAAARDVLGPDAFVAGRLGLWYIAGAAYWYSVESEALWRPRLELDPATYFSKFDAVADHYHMSWQTANEDGATLSSWYANGTFQLRGFYFGRGALDNSYLLLSPRRAASVVGYGLSNHALYRFEEAADGEYAFVSLVCPNERTVRNHPLWGRALFHNLLDLSPVNGTRVDNPMQVNEIGLGSKLIPIGINPNVKALVVSVIVPRGAGEGWTAALAPSCTERDQIPLRMEPTDVGALLGKAAEDRAIRFLRSATGAEVHALSYSPADGARTGDMVDVTVDVQSAWTELSSVQLVVNKATDGSASGDWLLLPSQSVTGRSARATFQVDTSELGSGSHRVGVNVVLMNGERLWWYQQPVWTYAVR